MTKKDDVRALCRADLMQVELALVRTYTSVLLGQPKYSAIDGGAHAGYHTERFGRLENCTQVVAVEADPWTVEKLRSRVARFGDSLKAKTVVVQAALQEDPRREKVTWMSSVSHPGRSGISSIWQNDNSVKFREQITVAATTLDALAGTAQSRVGIIKLDLEGGDFMALRGGGEVLRKDRPYVVFENSNKAPGIYGFSIQDMMGFFSSVGYAAVTFFGEEATEANWFDFWEMWAVPVESKAQLQVEQQAAVNELIQGGIK